MSQTVVERPHAIGAAVRQKDGRPRVTGEAKYYDDVHFPNMLHTFILRSPYPQANIVSLDVSAAEAAEGVELVMTYKDYPTIMRQDLHYVGDLVAAVIAETKELAELAAGLIVVEYEKKPFVLNMDDAMRADAPKVFEDKENLQNWPYHGRYEDRDAETGLFRKKVPSEYNEFGDIDAGFADADIVVEQRDIRYSYCKSPAMEAHGCTAAYDGHRLQMYTHSQGMHDEKRHLAEVLGMDASLINYISPYTGSSFGGKNAAPHDINAPSHYLTIAANACMKLKRPVNCTYSREEEMLCSWSRGSLGHVKIGFKKDGTLTTMDFEHIQELGAGGDIYPPKNAMLATGAVLYSRNCKNLRGKIRYVNTNRFTSVGWQGYGAPEGTYEVETTMDIAAEQLGMDPVELRKMNCMRTGDVDAGWDPMSYVSCLISSSGIAECLDEGKKRTNWDTEWQHPSEKTGRIRHGLGVAIFTMGAGRPGQGNSSEAMVKIFPDGSASLVSAVADFGQGQHTVQCQIVAEALGLPFNRVGLVCSETDATPFSTLQANSCGTWLLGWATYEAAMDARRQLLELGAAELKVSAEELDLADGIIFVKNAPEQQITVAKAFGSFGHYGGRHEIIGYYVNNNPHPSCMVNNDPSKLYIPKEKGAQFISLDVDTWTGMVSNIKVTMVQNVGKALNMKVVEGQLCTARHGVENAALGNDCIVDKRNGWLLTPNFIDYKPSTIMDCDISPVPMEIPGDPTHPYGATACGEGGACPTIAAYANALYNAVGVRFKDAPFTPEKILNALGKGKVKK